MTNNRCPGEKKLQQQQEEGEEDPPRPGIWLDVRLSVCLSNKKLYLFVVSEKEVLILSGQTKNILFIDTLLVLIRMWDFGL